MRVSFRPIEGWPGEQTPDHQKKTGAFQSTWTRTLERLEYELERLDAEACVISLALNDGDIRIDGWPKAKARPLHAGVILQFEGRYGRQSFVCDTYALWQHNVHAIMLTLEALRAVDRYGATRGGQQYEGFRPELEAAPDYPTTRAQALDVLQMAAGVPFDRRLPELPDGSVRHLVKRALLTSHPDQGGSEESFIRVNKAREIIESAL